MRLVHGRCTLRAYHDDEWGVPIRDDRQLFGLLAGGSRLVSRGSPSCASGSTSTGCSTPGTRTGSPLTAPKIEELMADPGIIRNRLKIEGAVKNANAYLRLQAGEGPFSDYLWGFVGEEPQVMRPATLAGYRSTSPESDAMSKDLKKRGFTFVGAPSATPSMQSAGMVDDHMEGCWKSGWWLVVR